MNLKIVKYKHYGCTMDGSEEDNSRFKNKFYWTFFELSNGKIISLNNNVDYEFEKITHSDIECHYTEHYKFGEKFFDWWDKTMENHDKRLGYPTKEEEDLVEDFFKKHIEKIKEVSTEIVYT